MDVRYRDERFAQGGLRDYITDRRFAQRCTIEDGLIICETLARANCRAAAALREVYGLWDWWDHGKVYDFMGGRGYTDQVLAPVSWFITRVGMRQYEPIPWNDAASPGLRGSRVPMLLSGHFRGTATVDILEEPGTDAGILLRGRFHGVENHVPGAPAFLAAKMHLRAESGRLYWPLPQGTGFRGLLRRLEAGPPATTPRQGVSA